METMTARKLANKIKREQATIDAHKNQKHVKELTISIEWKRSRTWGWNPCAEVEVQFQDGTFERKEGYRFSGCGYDKESTVIAEIFNDFLRYKLYQKRELKSRINGEDTIHPYGVYYFGGETKPMRDDGYMWKPSYQGGVGTSCYYKIAEFIGGKFENVANGKSFGVFKYTDNA